MRIPGWLSKIEQPRKRTNPSGKTAWRARATRPDGSRGEVGTFKTRGEAQQAILDAYERWAKPETDTLGAYAADWTTRHPRSGRTNTTNASRLRRILDVSVEGVELRHWPLRELRRRHVGELADHLLRVDGRAAAGAQNVLRVLSALFEDAITDELADVNPVRGVRVRSNDPRVVKAARVPRVWTFEEMHGFATAAREAAWTNPNRRKVSRTGNYERADRSRHPDQAPVVEALVRTLADTGLRLGEALGLERRDFDGQVFRPRGTAHNGMLVVGDTSTKGHVRDVPCPPGLAALIAVMPRRIDTPLLFPTPSGRMWWERNFYRDVWVPTVEASAMGCTPHEFRHSYLTHLAAAGILDADLADVAGHGLDTLIGRYRHPVRRSFDLIREVIG